MANANVKTPTEVEAQADDTDLNPTLTSDPGGGPGVGNRKVINIQLVVDGIDVTAANIFDMVNFLGETATGAGTTSANNVVSGEKEYMARGSYIFNVGPA